MAKPLDFIVFGVPRSGTKGLVRALNLHPHVYCAMERFHYAIDHAALRLPESLLEARWINDQQELAKIERIKKELARRSDVQFFGNKLPRYFFALNRINQEIPTLKNIWIYRSPYGFMPSWNVREQERGRGRWPAGQIGLFGLLELFVCISNCLNSHKDVFVFPYEAGLRNSAHVMLQALEFLGADPGLYVRETFEKKQNGRIGKRLHRNQEHSGRHALKDYEEEILHVLQLRRLDSIINRSHGIMVSELAALLREFLAEIASVLPQAFDRAFTACEVTAATSFGYEYYKRFGAELQASLQLANGPIMLPSFRHFSLYGNLRMYGRKLKRSFADAKTRFGLACTRFG